MPDFIKLPIFVKETPLDLSVNMDRILYFEKWVEESGEPDNNSLRMVMTIGEQKRVFTTLEEIAQKPGFVLCNHRFDNKKLVICIRNIVAFREYPTLSKFKKYFAVSIPSKVSDNNFFIIKEDLRPLLNAK